MMRALADRFFASPLGRSLSLVGLGVASVHGAGGHHREHRCDPRRNA